MNKHPIIKGYGCSTMPEDMCPKCGNNFVWVNDLLFDGMNRCDNCGNTWIPEILDSRGNL